jgi:acetyl esterase/lipase
MGCTSSSNGIETNKKPLFSYQLQGEWKPEEKAMFDGLKTMMDTMPPIDEESIINMREMSKVFVKKSPEQEEEFKLCETEVVTIDASKYGSDNTTLPIRVHKVKGVEDKNRGAAVFFHGGAVVTLDAEQCEPTAVKMALDGDVTVFNVDFRNGPEAKAP